MASILCCFGSSRKKESSAPTAASATAAVGTTASPSDPEKPVVDAPLRYVHVIQHAASDAMVAAPSSWRDMDQSLVRQELLRHQTSRQGSRADLLSPRTLTPIATPSPGQSPMLYPVRRLSLGLRSESENGRLAGGSSSSSSQNTALRSQLHLVTNHRDVKRVSGQDEGKMSAVGQRSRSYSDLPIAEDTKSKEITPSFDSNRLGTSADSASQSRARQSVNRLSLIRSQHLVVAEAVSSARPGSDAQGQLSQLGERSLGDETWNAASLQSSDDVRTSCEEALHKSSAGSPQMTLATDSGVNVSLSSMSQTPPSAHSADPFSAPNSLDDSSSQCAGSTQVIRKPIPVRPTQSSPFLRSNPSWLSSAPNSPTTTSQSGRDPFYSRTPPAWMTERSIRSHQAFHSQYPDYRVPKTRTNQFDAFNISSFSLAGPSTATGSSAPSEKLTDESSETGRLLRRDPQSTSISHGQNTSTASPSWRKAVPLNRTITEPAQPAEISPSFASPPSMAPVQPHPQLYTSPSAPTIPTIQAVQRNSFDILHPAWTAAAQGQPART